MICFVTNEISPGKRGGVGVYVEEALASAESAGLPACLLLMPPETDRAGVERHLRSAGLSAPVFCTGDWTGERTDGWLPPEAFGNRRMSASYDVALALREVCRLHPIRVVEFLDWGGIGFFAVRRKRLLGELADQFLVVRAHGTMELLQRAENRAYGFRRNLVTQFMERYAIRHADLLLASTAGVLREYNAYYGRTGPGAVSPLPVRRLTAEPLPLRPVKPPPCTVLFAGTMQRQKGPALLIEAAISLLEQGLEGVRFVLLARAFPTSVRYGSYEEELKRLIPSRLRPCFEFRSGYYGPDDLLRAAKECSFAVVPSRWEAFCLVAHELRWAGTPLVLSDIAPLRDCFAEGRDARFFDGTAADLARVMGAMLRGGLPMAGTEEPAALRVRPGAFADVYRDSLERQGARPAPPAPPDEQPSLSVIVANDGGAARLEATVRSVLAATYANLELMVVDCGPECVPARDALGPAGYGDRVQFAGACRGHRGEGYNVAVSQTEGEFVCCLPAGLTVTADYFARAVSALQRCPDAALVSCARSVGGQEPGRPERTDVPYGLDPVLITLEDGAGMAGAVLRRADLEAGQVRYRADLFALDDWELGWSLAERGLAGEVLPEVHVFCDRELEDRSLTRMERHHLRHRMADAHPALTADRPARMLQGHMAAQMEAVQVSDGWLMANCRGLRLVRLGVRKCLREGPWEVLRHLYGRLRGRWGPRAGGTG